MPTPSLYVVHNATFRWLVGAHHSVLRFACVLTPWYAAALLVCWVEGSLVLEGHVGLLQDLVMGVLYVLLIALVSAVRVILARLDDTLAQLPSFVRPAAGQGAAGIADDAARIREIVSLVSPEGRRWHAALMAFFLVLVYVFQVHIPVFAPQPTRAWPIWPEQYPLSFAFGTAWALFYWVLVIGNAAWYALSAAVLTFVYLRRYTREGRLLVVPVAPDRKGGLSVLGRFSFSLSLLAATGLIFVVAWLLLFGLDLALVLGFSVYIVALAGLFFIPLVSVHKAMQDARDAELARIAGLFRQAYDQLPPATPVGVAVALHSELEMTVHYLGHLDRLYQRAEAMPVWPFNLTTLSQFFTLVVVPLLLFVVQAASQNWVTEQLRRLLP